MPVRRFLFHFLSLLGILAFAAVLWAPFLPLIPGADPEALGGVARVRMLAGALFVTILIVRFLIRPPKQPSRRSIVWGEFAASSGGTANEEPRRYTPMGWTGGTTVRWSSRGTDVTLTTSSDTDRNDFTQFAADVRLTRGFQFHIAPVSLLTKVLFSNQLWSIALKSVKKREGQAGAGSPGVADRLKFLGEKELLLGDPALDDALLVKSDSPALAREFFLDAGVSYCLHEMNKDGKGWQLSLMSRGSDGDYLLTLSIPGPLLDPQGLDAGRKLIEASIRCLADRGMLAPASPRAA